MTNKRFPVNVRLEAVEFYRNNKIPLKEVALRFGTSKRSLIRWLHQYDPKNPFVSFVPIVVDSPVETAADASCSTPSTVTPSVIPVAITTCNGATVHLHLRSLDEIAALIESLENHAQSAAQR